MRWLVFNRNIPGLIILLDDKDYGLKDFAAQSLGDLKDSHVVEPSAAAFKKGNCGAAEALGKIGDKRAVDPILVILKDQIQIG